MSKKPHVFLISRIEMISCRLLKIETQIAFSHFIVTYRKIYELKKHRKLKI